MSPARRRWAVAALMAVGGALAVAPPAIADRERELPDAIKRIMEKPRYSDATWSLAVADLGSGRELLRLNSRRMSLTGSTRKLFSVGSALTALGPRSRRRTPVYRLGRVDRRGDLRGSLVLKGSGDLVFGGRRLSRDHIEYTDFDHGDANQLGTAILTPQNPLRGLSSLARRVREAGVKRVRGEVVVDDRLFQPYRVPNGNLRVAPTIVNENLIDVTVEPTEVGEPAKVVVRPRSRAFRVHRAVTTVASGEEASIELSDDRLAQCVGEPGCAGTVSGTIPVDYRAPLTESRDFVGAFRIEDSASYARIAFMEALQRAGVEVDAPIVRANPARRLPGRHSYSLRRRLARHTSAPFSQTARLVLKVSLNLGANLSLSLFGLEHGARTRDAALAAERRFLVRRFGIPPGQFDFPTNGSGTPDSRASPEALVRLVRAMHRTSSWRAFKRALPIMGVDGSLAHTGVNLAGRGRVRAKPGTTILATADGEIELKAQNLAGVIRARSGRQLAYALMVNDVGVVEDIERDVAAVYTDEARISNEIFKGF